MADPQGRVLILYLRDPLGGIAESTWFGIHGEPVEVAGVWATRRTFDDMGRVLETTTWNAHGEITEFPGGFARTRFSYHPKEPEDDILLRPGEQAVMNTVMGCHGREHTYDHRATSWRSCSWIPPWSRWRTPPVMPVLFMNTMRRENWSGRFSTASGENS